MGLASGLTRPSVLDCCRSLRGGGSGPPTRGPILAPGRVASSRVRTAILAPMRVAILGFGLIGGSIARALAEAPDREAWSVVAWSPTGDGPRQAAADGVIEAAVAAPAEALDGAQLVVLAAPPTATLGLIARLGAGLQAALEAEAVVTDVASTKGVIVAAAADRGLRFVGGHPMAGRETSGFGAADASLFRDRPWVVV